MQCIGDPEPRAGQLAHTQFTPNLLFQPMRAIDVAVSAVNRAVWASEVLLGPEGVMRRYAHEIAMERWLAEEAALGRE